MNTETFKEFKEEKKKEMGWKYNWFKFLILFDWKHQKEKRICKKILHHKKKLEEYRNKLKNL